MQACLVLPYKRTTINSSLQQKGMARILWRRGGSHWAACYSIHSSHKKRERELAWSIYLRVHFSFPISLKSSVSEWSSHWWVDDLSPDLCHEGFHDDCPQISKTQWNNIVTRKSEYTCTAQRIVELHVVQAQHIIRFCVIHCLKKVSWENE